MGLTTNAPITSNNNRKKTSDDQLGFFFMLPVNEEIAALQEVATPALIEPVPVIVRNAPDKTATAIPQKADTPPTSKNYRIKPSNRPEKFSFKEQARINIEAIKIIKKLQSEGRPATDSEKDVLVKYSGWGGLATIFNSWDPTNRNFRDQLEELLTEKEFDSAKSSTINSHYTGPDVIHFIYSALQKMGFQKGRIIEPAIGSGNFIGNMPEQMMLRSKITGVEIDAISGAIAKALYPDCDIRLKAYEETTLAENFYDVAVSNVPFGNYQVYDPVYNAARYSIHDYFFAKTVNLIRPGGLLIFITSRYTLDKKEDRIRRYLAEKADLIAAIRLPDNAFKNTANTDVTTDIIILQKRHDGEIPSGHQWTKLATFKLGNNIETAINEYFTQHPYMMLGTLQSEQRQHGRQEIVLKARESAPLNKELENLLQYIPQNIITKRPKKKETAGVQTIPAPDYVKNGAYIIAEGKLYRKIGDALELQTLSANATKRVAAMTKIRDEVRQLLHDEISSWDEQGITYRRQNLNYLYDRFISQYGFINSRENRSAFSEDPDYPLLLSLEIYDEEKKKATKADIFKTRVIHPNKKITHVDSVKEAFLVTLNELGKVNFARMSELCGKSENEIITELGGLIYKNPEGDKWETADAYLSGDVRKKLRAAQSAAIIDPSYAKNIDALRAVQPEDLKFDEIYVNLGTPWIPGTDIEKFIEHILGQKYEIRASYSPVIGTWAVQIKDSDKYSVQTNVNNTKKWGTSRYSAVELIDDALNHRIPTVTDWNVLKEKYVINEKETEAAREKQHLIKDTFKEWLWSDRERRERLTASYNENYNNIRPQTFDGSHLTLPGKTANITMMKSQLDAIWRIIQTGNTLLGHLVGAGKTYIQIAAAMEMKRLGLAAKPIIIVPNNLLEQWAAEFLRLYPLANVLAAGKKDFTPVKRKTLMSRIATGNWDAILVTHSSFEKLPMSNEAYIDHIQKQIDELEDAIYSFGSEKSKQTKELEKAKKRLETKIKLRLKEHKKDDCLTFEELGIDMIEVDEADLFKNLFFVTKMTRVAGLPNTESNRAYDLFIKVSWLNNRDLTTVFATGTPVSNTMAEMYTMKRYLAPKLLRKYGLEHFDAWAHMFGEVVTTLEIAPDGSGYRLRSRFARFINLPELQQIFWSFADIQTDETLTLDKPQIEGGKPYIIKAPASPELTKYVQSLIKRAEKLRKGGVDPREDNMLNITTDGRKAALDMRVVSRREKDFEHSKINKAVAIIYEEYKRTENNRGTQLFFCDLSTPNDRAFNVYDDIRAKLVRLGVPKEEIAYIHEADTDDKLKRLYSKVNAGSIRILMGSTTKMGAGMNVQRLLSSIHHLDCPWRPRDIEQREGRILRPGNENKTVRIYRYVTEGSFDAYMWQTVEAKARFIAQIMTKKISVRCAEDVDNRILTYAELKVIASGNPLVKEKFEIDIELRRLMTLKSQHQAEKYRMENDLVLLPERIERAKTRLLQYQNDLAARKIPADFKITIEGNTYGEREAAGNKIISLGLALRGMDSYTKVGAFAGFDLYIKTHQYAHLAPSIIARGEAEHIGTVSESAFGTIQSLEYNVKNIEQKIKEYSADIEDMSNNLTKLKEEMDKPFPYEEKIQKLLLRQVKIDKLLDLDKRELTGGLAANEQSNAAAA